MENKPHFGGHLELLKKRKFVKSKKGIVRSNFKKTSQQMKQQLQKYRPLLK